MEYRTDQDTLGEIKVPAARYWGPQTQRSLQNFAIGSERFDPLFIHALATIKIAAAQTNCTLGALPKQLSEWIQAAGHDVLRGALSDEFPLSVWQTGSGTQTNMNVNEVIANRANELAGNPLGSNDPVHPNDHVNRSQSSNDVFPTAMHIAAVSALRQFLYPALEQLHAGLLAKSEEFAKVVKIGRTHMMDATPMTLGQEFSGFAGQVGFALQQIKHAEQELLPLAIGGTAVGTGLNSPKGWDTAIVTAISELTSLPFISAQNKFMALSAHDALLNLSSALKQAASAFLVIGDNLRMLASGPRCGLGEIKLPANEPGSSIMPGKVNPTQIEAMTMVAVEVMGNDVTVTLAASQAHLQLNVFKPVIIHNLLRSIHLMSDAANSFHAHCLSGIEANPVAIEQHLQNSLMLVTALAPRLGYEQAAAIAKHAFENDMTLRQAVLKQQVLTEGEFDELVDPSQMLGPH